MSRPLHIVRVIPFLTPQFGGPAIQCRAVAAELARRGHTVDVITSDLGLEPDVPRDSWRAVDGYRVFHARARGWQRSVPYPTPQVTARVLDEVAGTADVLCGNVGLSLWNTRARRVAQRSSTPFVYNAEGALCPARLRVKRRRKTLFLCTLERGILARADALQAVTEIEREHLVAQGADAERIHVIPNGVPIGGAAADGRAFRHRFGIAEDAVVVLFLGRLDPLKGIDLLLESARAVLPDAPRLTVVVAGPDYGHREQLEQLASAAPLAGRVVFPGLLDTSACRDATAAADVFALTSHTEGLPNGVLEAAAAGLPLLVTEGCNVPEVAEFDAGHVAPASVPDLTAALRELAVDVTRRSVCGANARRMAQERFALDRVVDRLERLYRELAQR